MNDNGRCSHGAYEAPGLDAGTMFALRQDVQILMTAGSNKVRKKAKARLEKLHSRFVTSDGKSMALANMFAAATEELLKGNNSLATSYCLDAIDFQGCVWRDKPTTNSRLIEIDEQVHTERGPTLYLAGKIPCSCLDRMKENAKNQTKTAFCKTCKQEKPLKELFQCSICQKATYCSRECQQSDWKEHKKSCNNIVAVGGAEKPKAGSVTRDYKTRKGKKGKAGRMK